MRAMAKSSPRIESVSWGVMEIEGLASGKDFKLYPGGGRPWDWRETGTRHRPGIQPADVQELLEHGCEVVVFSRGMKLVLQTCPETLELLQGAGVEIIVAETTEAVSRYNAMVAQGRAVGGLFHSTC